MSMAALHQILSIRIQKSIKKNVEEITNFMGASVNLRKKKKFTFGGVPNTINKCLGPILVSSEIFENNFLIRIVCKDLFALTFVHT